MKKSLVIISFAFIFLLSVSIVSANFFDWLNGNAVSRAGADILPTRVIEGNINTIQDYEVAVINIENGIVEASVTNIQTGVTEQISLEQGENVLNNGAVLDVSGINGGSLFRKPSVTLTFNEGTGGVGGTSSNMQIDPNTGVRCGYPGGPSCSNRIAASACDNLVKEMTLLLEEFNAAGSSSLERINCADAGCKENCRLDLQGDAEIPCAYS